MPLSNCTCPVEKTRTTRQKSCFGLTLRQLMQRRRFGSIINHEARGTEGRGLVLLVFGLEQAG
jgi:hypothetical protein